MSRNIKSRRLQADQLTNFVGRMIVLNESGSDISADDIVTISGITTGGGHLTIEAARDGVTDETELWIAAHDIPDDETGEICLWRVLTDQDTSGAAADGDPVYLSDAAAGAWVITAPAGSPITVGKVITKHASTGVVLLRPRV